MGRSLLFLLVLVSVALIAQAGARAEGYDLRLMARRCIGGVTDEVQPERSLTPGAPQAYGEKSVGKAMLMSAVVPGLGQIYVGGRRGYIVGGTMAAVDAFSIWQYFSNDGKGDDRKGEYEAWAARYYDRDRFHLYVCDTLAVTSAYFSDCPDPGSCDDDPECLQAVEEAFPLSERDDGLFYEQIGMDDRYVFGWVDWYPYGIQNHQDRWLNWEPGDPLPEGIPATSARKAAYNDMRKEADDFYAKADRFAWIMVIGRVVSMVDAAVLAKLRNRDLAGFGSNPRLTFDADLSGRPDFKVILKMRF